MKVLTMMILMTSFLVSCSTNEKTDANGQKCSGKSCVKISRLESDK